MVAIMDVASAIGVPASTIVHRRAFHYAYREWDESVESWYMRLKNLAEPCLFGNNADAFLLNKLVVDLSDETSTHILNTNGDYELTLKYFVDTAVKEEKLYAGYIDEVKVEVVHDDSSVPAEIPADESIAAAASPNRSPTVPVWTYMRSDKIKKKERRKRADKEEEEPRPKRKYVRRKGISIESNGTNLESDGIPTRPKRKQNRTPRKYYCDMCPEREFNFKCKSESEWYSTCIPCIRQTAGRLHNN